MNLVVGFTFAGSMLTLSALPDATLSPDNRWMIYSSITPYVHLVPTRYEAEAEVSTQSEQQVMLDFSNQGSDDAGVRWRSGVRRRDALPWIQCNVS